MSRRFLAGVCFVLVLLAGALQQGAAQQDPTEREVEKFRQMLRDPFANPGNLWVDRGEVLWKEKRGPKNASLEDCDLGQGRGKIDGAYAALPRFFADADRVMDLETRLVWCMEKLQGFNPKDVVKTAFSNADRKSDLEALTAFVASKSNGQKLTINLDHPKMQEAYALGEALFYRRQGPWDFSCATCHDDPGKRIRLQQLPLFAKPQEAQEVMRTWPAFRVSQQTLRTMQHRLMDCYWQMRLPQVDYGSDVTVALTTYLAKKGEGGVIEVPYIKR